MPTTSISLSYQDYLQGIQALSLEEQISLLEKLSANVKKMFTRQHLAVSSQENPAEAEQIVPTSQISGRIQEEIAEPDEVLRKLAPLIEAGVIIPHTKKLRKATMPTIKVSGTPLSQMIIEDRR